MYYVAILRLSRRATVSIICVISHNMLIQTRSTATSCLVALEEGKLTVQSGVILPLLQDCQIVQNILDNSRTEISRLVVANELVP